MLGRLFRCLSNLIGFYNLNLSISKSTVSTKIYDKRGGAFDTVNARFLTAMSLGKHAAVLFICTLFIFTLNL